MKKLILTFEKRLLKNRELRVKFPDEPTKFMESEIELHESIQQLRALATAPDLYNVDFHFTYYPIFSFKPKISFIKLPVGVRPATLIKNIELTKT